MSLRFNRIVIDGYRGRHFELVMPADEAYSVFEMDGNTGKTTTIELLRWCFSYRQSKAMCTFRHMWANPAHVLDWDVEGTQECSIQIFFEDQEGIQYRFERRVIGEHVRNETDQKCGGDLIDEIADTLEFGKGLDVIEGDDVHRFLSRKFKLDVSAEYLCFDGEKAREMMILATKVNELIERVRLRTTHQQIQSYLESLDNLEDLLISEVGRVDSDRSRKRTENLVNETRMNMLEQDETVEGLKDDLKTTEQMIEEQSTNVDLITEDIVNAKSKHATRKLELEREMKEKKQSVDGLRRTIYQDSATWTLPTIHDLVDSVKTTIREHGKLPEPYREDLIRSCLESTPPTCQICGREMHDGATIERVRQLGRQLAPHEVQTYLSAEALPCPEGVEPLNVRNDIRTLVERISRIDTEISSLDMAEEHEALHARRSEMKATLASLHDKLGETKAKLKYEKGILEMFKQEWEERKRKSDGYTRNKPLYDRIAVLRTILSETHSKMRKRTIDVIGRVISRAVSNILGERFSAVLDEDRGLLLGEDGVHGPEVGGYSGRLILSYLFAEAMSQVDPIIIDTPVGNVGTQRGSLAKHLKNNHSQVILLCLPTELVDFAEYFTDEVHKIRAEGGGN